MTTRRHRLTDTPNRRPRLWSYGRCFDSVQRLVAVTSNGAELVRNEYDHRGRRVRKITPSATTTFFYDEWNLVLEIVENAGGTTDRIEYYWGKDLSGTFQGAGGVGGLLYLRHNGAVYIPYCDNNGNVMGYFDSTGAFAAEYVYDAFGRTIAQTVMNAA